jgi:hypothetical protein
MQSAGRHTVGWDGLSSDGVQVAPGVYFLQMRAEGFEAIKRLVVLE